MIKDRIELAKHFRELGFRRGVEVGVADGRYAEILLQMMPHLEYTGVDLWSKYEGNWRNDEYQEVAHKKAIERTKSYKHALLVKMPSLEASLEFRDESLDFVFIDGAHDFDNVILDIVLWSKKVKKGGIVSGHDAYHFHNSGVMEAVTIYTNIHKIELNIIPRSVGGHKDDQAPCWYFIKP